MKLAKRRYNSPFLMGLDPGGDDIIDFGGSQGTSGEDPVFIWDSGIDPYDIDMFWLSYDETDLAGIDTNGDLFISKDEFDAWYDAEQPW